MIKNFEEYEVLLNQFLEKKISTEIFQIWQNVCQPDAGLEPATARLRVWCSTD